MTEHAHVCTDACRWIVRDGHKLRVAECRHKLAREQREFNKQQRAHRKTWLGPKEKR